MLGKAGELTKQQELLRSNYAEGIAAYRARRWEDARNAFSAALQVSPANGPSRALLSRIDHLQADPPPTGWDGSWQMEHK